MEEYILVAVSPFYEGRGWTDVQTGITFKPNSKIYPIRISKKLGLNGIKNSIRLNNLFLLEGTVDSPDEEVAIANVNPEELTKAQFDTLVAKISSGADDGIGQPELDAEIAKTTEANRLKGIAEAAKTKAEGEKATAVAAKTKAETEVATLKDEFFKKHTFTESEVGGAYYTVAILKEIMTAKSIAFAGGDSKSQLITKLVAGQV